MKLKMYFIATSDEVIAGPFFTLEQAFTRKENLNPLFRPLTKIVKLDGQFELVEVE